MLAICGFGSKWLTTFSQHHRFLQFHRLRTSWRFGHKRSTCLMGFWIGQLCLCMAGHLDHRYIRSSVTLALHLPTDGMDLACCRALLLDSQIQQCSLGSRGALYLLGMSLYAFPSGDKQVLTFGQVRRILFSRRRTGAFHILGRSLPTVTS